MKSLPAHNDHDIALALVHTYQTDSAAACNLDFCVLTSTHAFLCSVMVDQMANALHAFVYRGNLHPCLLYPHMLARVDTMPSRVLHPIIV